MRTALLLAAVLTIAACVDTVGVKSGGNYGADAPRNGAGEVVLSNGVTAPGFPQGGGR